jgi:APA family basic amino acid/polyamine antiporter
MPQEMYTRQASGLVKSVSGKTALMYNLVFLGYAWPLIYISFAPALFPGVNMSLSVLFAAPIAIAMSVSYYFFTVAMPRSGGDFVWVSRSISPLIGFIESFVFAMIMSQYVAILGGWFSSPALQSIFINWGTETNNTAMISQINSFLTPTNLFFLTVIVILGACAVNFFSMKVIRTVQWVCFGIGMIGILAFIALMLAAGHNAFVSRFNSASGATYNGVISTATSHGYVLGFTVTGIVLGSLYAFQNFAGWQYPGFLGGEIKQVNKAQALAIFGGIILLTVANYVVYQVAYTVAGSDFVNSIAYVTAIGKNPTPMPLPYLGYLVTFATSNPVLAILPSFGFLFASFGVVIAIVLLLTRVFFAWSFDRILPTRISEIDDRFHAPRNALFVVLGISLIFNYLYYFTPILAYLTYGSLGLWGPQIVVGFAAMIFPYKRKNIFQQAPKFVQKKIGRVPLMVIFGFATMVGSVFNTVIAVLPIYTGAPINPIYISAFLLTVVAAPIIYAITYSYNRRIGVDMRLAFQELPPA